MKPKFVFVDLDFMRNISSGSERLPSLYYSSIWIIRRMFWRRLEILYALIERHTGGWQNCLDFGGGGGVFLPTLSRVFQKVICIDLETIEARKIVDQYNLQNILIIEEDIREVKLTDAPFDVIVAADVLEHFQDLSEPVEEIKTWLDAKGILVTSLPTESLFYRSLRVLFSINKPEDHFHSAAEVEEFLLTSGFQRLGRCYVPLKFNLLSLFSIAAWKLE